MSLQRSPTGPRSTTDKEHTLSENYLSLLSETCYINTNRHKHLQSHQLLRRAYDLVLKDEIMELFGIFTV